MNRVHVAVAVAFAAGTFAGGGAAMLVQSRAAPGVAKAQTVAQAPAVPVPRRAPCPACEAGPAPEARPTCLAPAMPGLTQEEEERAEDPYIAAALPMLKVCKMENTLLHRKLSWCKSGKPEPPPPPVEPDQDPEILMRSYDTTILVRRVDGTARFYPPGTWPPEGGIGQGNRIIAKAMQRDGGRQFLAPIDAGDDYPEPPPPAWLDAGAAARDP